jgi:hypothetical protein
MKYIPKLIYNTLAEHDNMVRLLAVNEHWSGNGDMRQENSIVYGTQFVGNLKAPFVLFDFGTVPSLGKSRVAQVYIRIYDERVGNVFKLFELKELVREALADKILSIIVNKQKFEYHFTQTLEQPIREDEALNLNFVEVEFDCLVV